MDEKFTCSICERDFKNNFTLRRHQKSQHCPDESEKLFRICTLCNREFHDAYSLKRHQKNIHVKGKCGKFQKFKFSSIEAFQEWKLKIEKETTAYFVKHSSSKSNKNGSMTAVYHCNRSGFFRSDSKNKRRPKCLGSNKINKVCPAKMRCNIQPNGDITVFFLSKHEGHAMDIRRVPVLKEERRQIAEKIVSKSPFDEILNNIRDSITGFQMLSTSHLLKKNDLYHFEQGIFLNSESVKPTIDLIAIDAWINKEKDSDENVVKFYKSHGKLLEDHPELDLNDFILILMNQAQMEYLKIYGNDSICLDTIKGINLNPFELHILLVLDGIREGFPCAFMFTNRNDECIFKLLFSVIKKNINFPINPVTFMSDMDDVYYSAWCSVMCPVLLRLYCSWHVDSVWRQNLYRIEDENQRINVYKKLCTLMCETDRCTFEMTCVTFLNELNQNPVTKDFANYFSEHFSFNCTTWADCYRVEVGLNGKLHLERIHRTIKYIYFKWKSVKRIDKALHGILRFVRDRLITKGVFAMKLSNLKSRHKLAMDMSDEVLNVSANQWEIITNGKKEIFTISKGNVDCQCSLRCDLCSYCIHAYNCTCVDYCVKWNMCKHIHHLCLQIHCRILSDNPEAGEIVTGSPIVNDDGANVNILTKINMEEESNEIERLKQELFLYVNHAIDQMQTKEQLLAAKEIVSPLENVLQSTITVLDATNMLTTDENEDKFIIIDSNVED